MNTFEYKGRSVAYVTEGKGKPIIFIHNGGTTHAIWKHQLSDLSENFCVYALDLPGYGASEAPAGGYSLDEYTNLLSAFIEYHKLSDITLVGNCLGSAMSLRYAMDHRKNVSHVIAINPLTEATFLGGTIGALHSLNKRLPKVAKAIANQVVKTSIPSWATLPSAAPLFGKRGIIDSTYRDKDLQACLQLPNQSESLVGLYFGIGDFAILDQLIADTTFPNVCTIWGEQNKVLSAEAGRTLNKHLKPTQEEYLPDCGHLLMLERPSQVCDIIRDVLGAQKNLSKSEDSETSNTITTGTKKSDATTPEPEIA